MDEGFPKWNPGGLKGLPQAWIRESFDAILNYQGGKVRYLFKDGQYLRMTNGVRVDPGYPIAMPGGWRGIPSSWNGEIHAAMYFPENRKHYMFRDNEYIRLSGVKVDPGYPLKLPGGWRGMPSSFASGIDAALVRDNKVYMFKGAKYIRFTGTKMDAGYPKDYKDFPL
jgi:hypothetical protein